MLWDSEVRDVACNKSYGIVEFFNAIGSGGDDLAPDHLRREIDQWNAIVYTKINNGVYRCGFAQSQEADNAAVSELFTAMDAVEEHLSSSRYLCGDSFTLADGCLFTTLICFDLVYNVLFKCTKKKLVEYPNLHGYTREIYQMPKVAETCDFAAIVYSYYGTLFPLNPSGIHPSCCLILLQRRNCFLSRIIGDRFLPAAEIHGHNLLECFYMHFKRKY